MITLSALLSVISNTKTIKVNLFNDTTKLLIVSFDLPGYPALDDTIKGATVEKLEIVNLQTLNITISGI